ARGRRRARGGRGHSLRGREPRAGALDPRADDVRGALRELTPGRGCAPPSAAARGAIAQNACENAGAGHFDGPDCTNVLSLFALSSAVFRASWYARTGLPLRTVPFAASAASASATRSSTDAKPLAFDEVAP